MPDTNKQTSQNLQKMPDILREPAFLLGAAEPKQFPQDQKIEIAFAGRSNVGKSSAINAIAVKHQDEPNKSTFSRLVTMLV